ncbi:MAG: hypothetical protein ORN51_09780, partial [Akkermansiaceae bacterium]|nr:hypothetical protein [Akkermansiaceae bacterium]
GTKAKRLTRGCIRLLPVDGVVYSESFTRFMQRARFDSVRDAIASIRDRSLPVRISNTGNRAISPVATHSLGYPPVC